jgi:magnesium-transporting ATPase (P-type)
MKHGSAADRLQAHSVLNTLATADEHDLFARLASSPAGLEDAVAQARLRTQGPNRIAEERSLSIVRELWRRFRTPLNGLLLAPFGFSLRDRDSDHSSAQRRLGLRSGTPIKPRRRAV